jgi:beta-glucosidase-like glycosyl hydrolase
MLSQRFASDWISFSLSSRRKQIGLDLKSAGLHYNLAPLADINNNPNNPVIGENKEKVAQFALEYCADSMMQAF